MASTFAVTRNHLIFGLCLPLAVLLGYMLADIDDPASRLIILVTLGVLVVPLLMRWYHPLLMLSWFSAAQPALPGGPHLWALVALIGLGFAVLSRTVNPEHRFAHVPAITRPLILLTIVVVVTALLTGGIGLRIFGSSSVGGRGYFYLLAAVAGFFALSSRAIPANRAMLYAGLFFLPGLTAIIAPMASWIGSKAGMVYLLFPPESDPDDFVTDGFIDPRMLRVTGSVGASLAVFSWLLARHGIAGTFDLSRPWRVFFFVASVAGGMFGGFRSALVLMALVFLILYTLEKLWQTKLTLVLLAAGVVGFTGLIGFSDRLPLPVQRTLSFLPVNIDPATRDSADVSTQWRVEMWKSVLPEVPKHLIKGKGYTYSSDGLFMAQMRSRQYGSVSFEEAAYAGAYHNGLLSIIIPFGAAGLICFLWLLAAGTRFLYTMYKSGASELRHINTFLLALFLARILVFFFIFGSLYVELFYFTGILGFSVALNVAGKRQSLDESQEQAIQESTS